MSWGKPTACSRARADKLDNRAHDKPVCCPGEETEDIAYQLRATLSMQRDSAEP